MKKLVSLILTAALSLCVLSSCSKKVEDVTVNVGSLSGPTTIGIVNLMNDSSASSNTYNFTMATQPDEIASALGSGDLDIALIPANLASVLYNRTEGKISVIDINTLGVLYCLSFDDSVNSVADLSGKTVITTGQGATPEYAINYLLAQNGIDDCTLDFKSEGTEVIAALSEAGEGIAILPQPAATAALGQIEGLTSRFSLTDEWDKVTSDSKLIT
ncbi:MAG TPA: ABC transporter substrate-binding protein, partial [Clostridiales bacterium]|nr:ABC transporter substrate-binding protein [Clostridiales bacterium]